MHVLCNIYLQGTPVNIIVGSHVWVEDPVLAWIDGEVIRINGQVLHVQTTKGKTVSTTSLICFLVVQSML